MFNLIFFTLKMGVRRASNSGLRPLELPQGHHPATGVQEPTPLPRSIFVAKQAGENLFYSIICWRSLFQSFMNSCQIKSSFGTIVLYWSLRKYFKCFGSVLFLQISSLTNLT
jgi:hypothetical protein